MLSAKRGAAKRNSCRLGKKIHPGSKRGTSTDARPTRSSSRRPSLDRGSRSGHPDLSLVLVPGIRLRCLALACCAEACGATRAPERSAEVFGARLCAEAVRRYARTGAFG